MPYRPTVCEPFQSANVKPGWICCECGHFSRVKATVCHRCTHSFCGDMTLMPKTVEAATKRTDAFQEMLPPALKAKTYSTTTPQGAPKFSFLPKKRRLPIELQRLAMQNEQKKRNMVR
jgi:hypothetical protein